MRLRPLLHLSLLAAVAAAGIGAGPGPAEAAPSAGWVADHVRFVSAGADGGAVSVEGLGAYRGAIEVSRGGGGLAVVNALDIEDYVKGVMEVPGEWPGEALKAMAIAARTIALNRVGGGPGGATGDNPDGPHICPTDQCQVYKGVASERRPAGDRWVKAVDDTAGRVLLYRGKPIVAMYSASNGGRSVAGGQPYLRAVNDPDDARSSPLSHWHYAVPLAALAPVFGVAPPLVLASVATTGGGVVAQVRDPRTPAAPPTARSLSAADFRARATGSLPVPPGLPSALPTDRYTVSTSGDQAVVDGGGWGHGVGMSAWGAYGKARRGLSASDILAAYYSGIRPTTLPAGQRAVTVRVDLAQGSRSVAVTPERSMQVAAPGAPFGPAETGRWQALAAGGGVRVVPPDGWRPPLAVTTAALEPPGPDGGPVATYQLNAPAVVTVRYRTPAGQAGSLSPQAVAVAPVREPLPPADAGGDYQVVLDVDGGPGRAVSVPLHLDVPAPRRAAGRPVEGRQVAVAPARQTSRPTGPLVAAALLVVVVGLAEVVVAARARRVPT